MNRSYFALFVALLIHFILLLLFWLLGAVTPETKQQEKPKENRIKVSLKEAPKRVEKAEDANVPTMAPPMPKGSQLKEIAEPMKKPPIKYEPKKIEQQNSPKLPIIPTKAEDKKEPRPKIEPLPPTKPYVELPQKEKKKEKKPYEWLAEDKSSEEVKDKKSEQQSGSNVINSDLKELYGSEFGKLTPGQQKYLIDNQEIMRRITQEILNRIARVNIRHDMNINRTNIVEFYLHPNGDMTDFKFLQSSGYHILDTTTQETIEFAYSRYPRPAEKILVRYNVFYNLAR
ncbi:MAG: TonB family protein [Sulfurimonas sp.]|nr:TonB family protein [Sulfurimonas sp.]